LARLAALGLAGASMRVEEDGFFAVVPDAPSGSRLRYECMVNGVAISDIVPLAGLETFIYTGAPPSSIRLVEIVSGAVSGGFRVAAPRVLNVEAEPVPPSSRPRPPPVPTPRGMPPALPARRSSTMAIGTAPATEEPSEVVMDPVDIGAPVGDTSSWGDAESKPADVVIPVGDSSSKPAQSDPSPVPSAGTIDASASNPAGDASGDAVTDVSNVEVATDVSGTEVAPKSSSAGSPPSSPEAFLGNPRAY
jgi:hypothetical protein